METFSALMAICARNSPVPGEFPAQRPVTRSFVVFFDLCLNKRLSKWSWGWWFETLSCLLWRQCNVHASYSYTSIFRHHMIFITKIIYTRTIILLLVLDATKYIHWPHAHRDVLIVRYRIRQQWWTLSACVVRWTIPTLPVPYVHSMVKNRKE